MLDQIAGYKKQMCPQENQRSGEAEEPWPNIIIEWHVRCASSPEQKLVSNPISEECSKASVFLGNPCPQDLVTILF